VCDWVSGLWRVDSALTYSLRVVITPLTATQASILAAVPAHDLSIERLLHVFWPSRTARSKGTVRSSFP
jgi:hypothetical protein